MKKQPNHKEAVDSAYMAIALLRAKGVIRPSVTLVAKQAGLSRAVVYSKHADWVEVRDVIINDKTSKRLRLAGASLSRDAHSQDRFERAVDAIESAEAEIKKIRERADSIYSMLLEQLHKYVALSKNAPKMNDDRAKLFKELANIKEMNARLATENSLLRAQSEVSADVRPLSRKEVLAVEEVTKRGVTRDADLNDFVIDAVNKLDDYFTAEQKQKVPSIVYVLCGNFASGKSTWVKNHECRIPGVNLYVDGVHHTATMRKLLIRRIKKLAPRCIVACVWIRTALDICLLRNELPERVKAKICVPSDLIKKVGSGFEKVGFDEGFDEIIVSGSVGA